MTREAEVDDAVAKVVAAYGGVDVLVSNAGVQIVHKEEKFPFAEWKKMLAIHLDGAFLTTKACLPHMKASGRGGSIIYMGSVHSKEGSGRGVNILLSVAPHAAALARLGKVRSAGINDLRLGNILNAATGDEGTPDNARIDLPGETRCYAIAASLGSAEADRQTRLPGDGLVTVASALGKHRCRSLAFTEARRMLVRPASHLDLLSSSEVYGQLRHWLA